MVSGLVAVAVTVTDPPRLTEEPLMVMELLVSDELPMLDSVFVEPLIETPVSVVIVPPSDTAVDPIVIELFVRALFGRFVKVLDAPLIVLLVSVCELSVSTSVLLAGIVVPFSVVVELLVSVVNAPAAGVVPPIEPLSEPLVLDSEVNTPEDGVVAPIVVPLIAPPVIATALAFWVDIVPKPVMSVFGMVVLAVMALVPLPYT
jgi:hypothetical protein